MKQQTYRLDAIVSFMLEEWVAGVGGGGGPPGKKKRGGPPPLATRGGAPAPTPATLLSRSDCALSLRLFSGGANGVSKSARVCD
jgi:hypothetical protein